MREPKMWTVQVEYDRGDEGIVESCEGFDNLGDALEFLQAHIYEIADVFSRPNSKTTNTVIRMWNDNVEELIES